MRGRDVPFLMMAIYAAVWFATMRLYWDIHESPIRGSDFSSYYTAGRLVLDGQADALYQVAPQDSILGDATDGPWAGAGRSAGVPRQHYYIYPPFFAILFAPLSMLSYAAALEVWLALDLALLALFMFLYSKTRGEDLTFAEKAFMVAAALFEFLPLIWAMAIGQTSLIVLALLAGTLLTWKRGRDVAAGVLLGLAVSIKLTPALLSVFFLWRGRPKIAWVSLAVFAGTQIASIAALGWEPHRAFYMDVIPSMSGGTCYFLNQSLGAFFNRLLTPGDVRQVDLVSSVPARVLTILTSLALLGACAAFLTRTPRGDSLSDEIQFGSVVLLTLILSPISWTHHYLAALLPLFAVVGSIGRRRSGPIVVPALLAGIAWLLIARKPHADLFLQGVLRVFNSAALAGALILLGLSFHVLRSRSGEARA